MDLVYQLPQWLLYAGSFGLSLLFSLGLTPVARRLALHLNIVDKPGGRKIHSTVIPYLGGLAIYGGFWLGLGLSLPGHLHQLLALSVAGTVVMFVGLVDDRTPVHPMMKLMSQGVGAVIVVSSGISAVVTSVWPVDAVISLVWLVGLSNAVNLLDNMDGLSSGACLISSLFLFFVADSNGQFLVASMALSLMGACLGFLRYNFAPAIIFMGDAGSLFLGFMLAAIALKLRTPGDPHGTSFVVPVTLLGLPILDTTLVTIQRIVNRKPFYLGGKDHSSHRLVLLGYSRRDAVLVLYLVAVSFGVFSLVINLHGTSPPLLGLAVVYAVALFAWFCSVSPYGRSGTAA